MTARRGHRTAVTFSLLLLSLLLAECAAPPAGSLRTVNDLSFRSRDGVFLYRIPDGWFDASADAESTGHAVWLIRDNLSVMLAVEEICMDEDVREKVTRGRLLEVGRLLSGLRAGKNGMMETRPAEQRALESRDACMYELANPATHEVHRVLLFTIDGHLYSASLIFTNNTGDPMPESSVRATLDGFVDTLR
jgi:hypothetical protein